MLEILKESHNKIKKLRERDAYINELYTTYETTKTVADRNILVDELANRFCKAYDESNEAEMDTYFSTLLVQCWKQMINFYNGVKVEGNIEYADLPAIFSDRLLYACKYRAWQNPEKKLHAHQCINMCIATEKANVFGRSNWQCNKTNTTAHRFNQEMFKLDDIKQVRLNANYMAQLARGQLNIEAIADKRAHNTKSATRKTTYTFN